jgi:hypothetical protein
MTVSRGNNRIAQQRLPILALRSKGDENMLGIIASVLIVLWLLGFFAFHVTTGLVHIILIAGIVLLAAHFLRGGRATA